MCTFTGDRLHSTASPGNCTQTAGYIADAEIESVFQSGRSGEKWHDIKSDTDFLVYDDSTWVAYMSAETKQVRRILYDESNFAGTIDWAVDLRVYQDDWDNPNSPAYDAWLELYLPPLTLYGGQAVAGCGNTYATLEDIESDAENISDDCLPLYLLQALQANISASMSDYNDMMANDYDDKFNTYADAVVDSAAPEVHDFMYAHGNKYFTCQVWESEYCTSSEQTVSRLFWH